MGVAGIVDYVQGEDVQGCVYFCNVCPGDYMLLLWVTFNDIQGVLGLFSDVCHGGYRDS